ncbi:hypothetical protein ACH5RR_025903 [Cinchona calisaya]|uniref:Uncharacterized protein n=1 Tax=Cinchona calisaya TaxID=153742 RepID=A0ABD2Z0Z1_9GENT
MNDFMKTHMIKITPPITRVSDGKMGVSMKFVGVVEEIARVANGKTGVVGIVAHSSQELCTVGVKSKNAIDVAIINSTTRVDLSITNEDIAATCQGKNDAAVARAATNTDAAFFFPSTCCRDC